MNLIKDQNGMKGENVRKKEICKTEGCIKQVVRGGLKGLCCGCGGGKRCVICGKRAVSGKFSACVLHGGGKRCREAGCKNAAVGVSTVGYCIKHSGGNRCKVIGCNKSAIGSTKRCRMHFHVSKEYLIDVNLEDADESLHERRVVRRKRQRKVRMVPWDTPPLKKKRVDRCEFKHGKVDIVSKVRKKSHVDRCIERIFEIEFNDEVLEDECVKREEQDVCDAESISNEEYMGVVDNNNKMYKIDMVKLRKIDFKTLERVPPKYTNYTTDVAKRFIIAQMLNDEEVERERAIMKMTIEERKALGAPKIKIPKKIFVTKIKGPMRVRRLGVFQEEKRRMLHIVDLF